MPLFSIILPTYNRARMVRTALKTVLLQTFQDWECVVVDDGSKDNTSEVLAEFETDKRMKVIRAPKNRGMNASRNAALEAATGRFATFLDSDDLWLPRRLQAFHERLERTPSAEFLFSNAYLWRFDRVVGLLFDPARPIPEGRVPGHYAMGEAHLPYVTTNVAVLREGFQRWGGFNEQLTTDTDLWARFLAGGAPVAAIPEPVSVRRIHGDQLSSKYVSNFHELMTALEATGASEADRRRIRADMAREVATYLVKSARPAEARAFLLAELGPAARSESLYRTALIPAPLLAAAKGLRQAWLRLRHHPLCASAEWREVHRFTTPLLAEEG